MFIFPLLSGSHAIVPLKSKLSPKLDYLNSKIEPRSFPSHIPSAPIDTLMHQIAHQKSLK